MTSEKLRAIIEAKIDELELGIISWEEAKERLSTLALNIEHDEIMPGLMLVSMPSPDVYLTIVETADILLERYNIVGISERKCRHDECEALLLRAAIELILTMGGDWVKIKYKIAMYINMLAIQEKSANNLFDLLRTCKHLLKQYEESKTKS